MLSAQFYFGEGDIGAPRAVVSARKLADLNQYVPVTVMTEVAEFTPAVLRQFKVCVHYARSFATCETAS